jgi:hypothetical protein
MIKTNDTTTSRRALLAIVMIKPMKLRKCEKEWCAEHLHKGREPPRCGGDIQAHPEAVAAEGPQGFIAESVGPKATAALG